MRHFFATFLAIALLGIPWFMFNYPEVTKDLFFTMEYAANQAAAVILGHQPKTIEEIKVKYNKAIKSKTTKVRILLVPGHEPSFGGTQFQESLERDVVVFLADELKALLSKDEHYEVFVTRDRENWSPEFVIYFKDKWNEIVDWQAAHKQEVYQLIRLGKFARLVPVVDHVKAPLDVATRLYGINKWAGENNIDIVIHIHINDYARSYRSQAGEYSGFAIYVPETQYYNSTTTQALAKNILKRLEKYNPVSNLPGESTGIVEDQDLIAIGSYNTVDAASMLIEYGYIYEPHFVNPETRKLAVKDLAYQTYIGISDFFDPERGDILAKFYDTVAVPYEWKEPMFGIGTEGPDIFALQTALLLDGLYPPAQKSKNDCPRTGKIGSCTKQALSDFQKKYGIVGETNMAGTRTLEILNKSYGPNSK